MKSKKLLICFFLALCVVTFQFTLDRQEHLRLAASGMITRAASTYHKDWSGEYAHFMFTTKDGRQIEHTQKCGSKQTFDEEYSNMKVIYNAKNPEEFMNWYAPRAVVLCRAQGTRYSCEGEFYGFSRLPF